MNPAPASSKTSTQEHLDVQDILEDLVLLKNGSCCLVLQTTALNFGLLSETEQDALIYAYAGFLNSLSFPIQVLIRSQKKDVTGYIKLLAKREQLVKNPFLQKRISIYRRFVEYIVRENEVLDKNFYIIIPFTPLEAGLNIGAPFSRKKVLADRDKVLILEKAKNTLVPKKDHIIQQLARLGLKVKQLTTEELIKLFFTIYNPEAEGQILRSATEYQSTAVRAGVTNQLNQANHD